MKPESFNSIRGHDTYKEIFKSHLAKGTCPHVILASGVEGIGKTAFFRLLAIDLVYGTDMSSEKSQAIKDIVRDNKSNESIKLYEMNVEGGKNTAKEVIAELKTVGMTPYHRKVIICDECHRMSKEAQDVFLLETEYMDKDVYLFFLTTDTSMIEPTLQSRAVPVHFFPLKEKEMVEVLRDEVQRRRLELQGGDSTLHVLAQWFGCKPRAALSQLQLFADGSHVSLVRIKTCLGMSVLDEILPLLCTFSTSLIDGIKYISEMSVNESVGDIVIEVLKVMLGAPSVKFTAEEHRKIRSTLTNVSAEVLTQFAFYLFSRDRITRKGLLYAYMAAHPGANTYKTASPKDIEFEELAVKASNSLTSSNVTNKQAVKAPTMQDLLSGATVIKQ